MRGTEVETRRDRAALAQDAGMRKVSFPSILAGTLVAYGSFAVLVAIAAAVARGTGLDTELSGSEWRQLGIAGGAVVAVVQFIAYWYGGYVAGRMSRRAGMLNGFLVFCLGVVLAVAVAGLVNMFTDTDDVLRNLRNIGIPTSGDEWQQIGTFAGIASLAAMLLGSMAGGAMGERWHGRLMRRAMDPTVGAGVPMAATADNRAPRATMVDDGTSIMDRRDGNDDSDRDEHIDVRDRKTATTLDEDREREQEHHPSGT